MKTWACAGLALASLCAHAQSQPPSVDVFGITKNRDHRQIGEDLVLYAGSRVHAFVEGSGLSSTFPAQPLTLATPGGSVHALEWRSSTQHGFEQGFGTEAAMEAVFPDGTYTIASGARSYQLDLIGSYVMEPEVRFSAGRWDQGTLILTAEQASADWWITSSFTTANGFRSISVYREDEEGFDFFSYDDGSLAGPGAVSRTLAGGSLQPGGTYIVEVEFDNVVDYIDPQGGDLRNGFALYSSATMVTVSVVPEPTAWPLTGAVLALGIGLLRMRRSKGRHPAR